MSTFHLNNIQQIPTGPNSLRTSIPSEPPLFSPPVYAIWVNTFLFLSLFISLFDALFATLLRHWARQYTDFIQQPGCRATKRARIRAFFFESVDKHRIFWVFEALPNLLHLSICLFIVGLIVWLFNINQLVFRAVISLVALPTAAYLWFTFLPILRPRSPFYSPLSLTFWSLYSGLSHAVLKALSSLRFPASRRFDIPGSDYRIRFSDRIEKTAKKKASKQSSEIDVRVLQSTLDALGEDSARSSFFAAIPGFFSSEHVKDLQEHLPDEFRNKFNRELGVYLNRTFSSNSTSESVRSDQLIICLGATHAVLGPDGVSQILHDILSGWWRELLQSIEMAQSLWSWGKSTNCDSQIAHSIRRIVTQVVVGVRGRDNRWISLTKDEFGVPDRVLRANIAHGDSALLSLLIHMTREAFRSGVWTPFILDTLTQFDMCNTLPGLQHEFCSLWNEILREAWRGGADCPAVNILREIRLAYLGLHQGADAFSAQTNFYNPVLRQPQSYRFCNIPGHCSPPVVPVQTLVISVG